MKDSEHYWIPVYRCEICLTAIELDSGVHVYNDYGAKQFPDVSAPKVISHKCGHSEIGMARLIGLKRKKSTEQREQQ